MKVESRNMSFNLTGNNMIVTGRAIPFNSPTVLYEIDGKKYYEVIDSRALNGVDLSDVVLVVDHEGKPAARTKNGTLKLEIRSDGLYIEADLSKNNTGRELHEDIKNGFYQTMSFSFIADKGGDKYNPETRTRTITKFKRIFDVSVVKFPAYSSTSISARGTTPSVTDKAKDNDLRQRLILLTYL